MHRIFKEYPTSEPLGKKINTLKFDSEYFLDDSDVVLIVRGGET